MLKNYFKVAIRNMMKRKGYTLLNILGLATGMAVCLLIVLFAQGEINFDNFNKKGDRIYRVALERKYPGRSTSYSFIPASIGEAIHKEFPEVEQSMRLLDAQRGQAAFIRIDDHVFEETKVLYADSNFFQLFTVPLIAGNGQDALKHPFSVVLNESTAKKYFGSVENAMGKTLTLDDSSSIVTGICKDLPPNSHFNFNLLVSATSLANFLGQPNYINFSSYTYLLLKPNTDAAALEAKFPRIIEKYVAGDIEKIFGVPYSTFTAQGNGYHYYLQPLTKIHLTSNLEGELTPNGSLSIVYAFSVIAFFILLLACVNFINLSTARSLDRAKEVGIRKTFGSERQTLIWQFLFESVIISFISLLIAIILVFVLQSPFNNVFGTHLNGVYLIQPSHLLILLLLCVTTGIVAGLYPAFVLSSFRPIVVLKGKFSFNPRGRLVRNSLVVFQFAISVTLIIATLIVNRQMQYMLGDQLGFTKDHVIVLNRADLLAGKTEAFRNDLLKIPGVKNASGTTAMPGQQNFFGVSFQQVGGKESLTGRGVIADDQFLSTLNIDLVKGRYFSNELATDSLAILLNEKAVSEFGLTDPIGARLTSPDGIFNLPDGTQQVVTVIGVVKDFHFQSLHQMITPLVFMNSAKFQNNVPVIAVRIESAKFKSVLNAIETTWDSYVPQHPIQFSFLDQQLADLYKSEEITQRLFTAFSVIAIFIACMGLLGLVTYATQKRSREIGIRKVLGASITNIITLLSRDFLKLVLIASVVSFPISWLLMNKWLQDFAYRINISWWVFGMASVITLIIALTTIFIHAIRAAIANPVKSLRME